MDNSPNNLDDISFELNKKNNKFKDELKNKIIYIHIEPLLTYPDPTELIINLALLYFLPIGTKLHFYNNRMYIQEKGFYQSISRTLFNGKKSEIALYPVSIVHGFLYNNDIKMRIIYEYAIKGLNKLNDTYSNEDNIKYTINKCIFYIECFLYKTKIFMYTDDTRKYIKNIKLIKIENKKEIFDIFINLISEENKYNQYSLIYKIINLLHSNYTNFFH